jgi:hypothetical protein
MLDIEKYLEEVKARIEDPERQEVVAQLAIDLVEVTAGV